MPGASACYIAPMRRLARSLFTLCSAASMLLCVAVCVLWVRGDRGDELTWSAAVPDPETGAHARRYDRVFSEDGTVGLSQWWQTPDPTTINAIVVGSTEIEHPQFPLL